MRRASSTLPSLQAEKICFSCGPIRCEHTDTMPHAPAARCGSNNGSSPE